MENRIFGRVKLDFVQCRAKEIEKLTRLLTSKKPESTKYQNCWFSLGTTPSTLADEHNPSPK
jgi:hypothetical protein